MTASAAIFDAARLAATLRAELAGEVAADPSAKGLYAVDASNYRVVPDELRRFVYRLSRPDLGRFTFEGP